MASHIIGIRWMLVGILLLTCAGCVQQLGDQLLGRWEGRPKGRFETPPSGEADGKSSPSGSSASRDASEPKDAVGPDERASTGRGVAPSNRVGTPSVQSSLLDAFDVTIRLHFADRENVQMSISGAGERAPRTGTWRVLENDGETIRIEIVSPGSSTDGGKPRLADGNSQAGDQAADKRQFLVRFSGDDQFTLTDPVAPSQQGELTFRRVE